MAAKRNVWTVKTDAGWGNRYEGSTRLLDAGPKTDTVQRAGRDRARRDKVEHIIQRTDGSIQARQSYGGDPPRRPG